MTRNPRMRVFVAGGYYDLATPYFVADYTFRHLGLDSSLAGNVVQRYYEGGHMPYCDKRLLKPLKGDLAQFIKETSKSY